MGRVADPDAPLSDPVHESLRDRQILAQTQHRTEDVGQAGHRVGAECDAQPTPDRIPVQPRRSRS